MSGIAALDQATLDFGEVSVTTMGTRTLSLNLQNTGTDYLLLDGASAADPELFSVAAPLRAIAPGETVTIEVTFTPTADVSAASTLTVRTSDPDAPTQEVALLGEGLAPRLALSSDTLDFGLQAQGCATTLPLIFTNTGREDLTLLSTGLGLTEEVLLAEDWITQLPLALPPGEAVTLEVSYAPLDSGADTVFLTVTSDDPTQERLDILVGGEGEPAAAETVVSTCTLGREADILFAVDKSCSMSTSNLSMIENFGWLIEALQEEGVDYRIAFIVQDSGQAFGGVDYIRPSDGTGATDLARRMMSGASGANTEKALSLLYAATDTSGPGYPGGWLREDADLHLIGVSDEEEQSADLTWAQYMAYFTALSTRSTLIHAVGGDYPSGCATAAPYIGMYEASQATGGLFLSICSASGWLDHMRALAEEIARSAAVVYVPLQSPAIPSSIQVTRDGRAFYGWTYDAEASRIVLTEEADCSTLEASYTVQEACL